MIIEIPVEYYKKFKQKPHRALRSIAGFSVRSGDYYLMDAGVVEAYSNRPNPLVNGRLIPEFVGKHGIPYYAHIDLSIKRDRAGFAMGHTNPGNISFIDIAFGIDPQVRGEIDIRELINLVKVLISRGFDILMVSFDSFQSSFIIQSLRGLGIRSEILSVDRTTAPYDCWRDALVSGTLDIYDVPLYREEAKKL